MSMLSNSPLTPRPGASWPAGWLSGFAAMPPFINVWNPSTDPLRRYTKAMATGKLTGYSGYGQTSPTLGAGLDLGTILLLGGAITLLIIVSSKSAH